MFLHICIARAAASRECPLSTSTSRVWTLICRRQQRVRGVGFCVVRRCAGCHNVKDRGIVSIVHYWFDNIEIEIAILMIMQIRLSINL